MARAYAVRFSNASVFTEAFFLNLVHSASGRKAGESYGGIMFTRRGRLRGRGNQVDALVLTEPDPGALTNP